MGSTVSSALSVALFWLCSTTCSAVQRFVGPLLHAMQNAEARPWGYEEVGEEEWGCIEQAMLVVEGRTAGREGRVLGAEADCDAVANSFARQRAQEWEARLISAGCDPRQARRKGEKMVADAASARARLRVVQRLECAASTPLPPTSPTEPTAPTKAAHAGADMTRAPGTPPSLLGKDTESELAAHAVQRAQEWGARLLRAGIDSETAKATEMKMIRDAAAARHRLVSVAGPATAGSNFTQLANPEACQTQYAHAGAEDCAPAGTRNLPQSFKHTPEESKYTLKFTGRIIYAASAREVESCCRELLGRAPLTCGFDIEWRTTFQRGVPPRPAALIQLCFAEADPGEGLENSFAETAARQGGTDLTCLLLHVKHSGLTPSLKRVLAEKTIRLTGIGARGDAHKLQMDHGVEWQGVVELLDEASKRSMPIVQSNSLANLCDAFFGAELKKIKSVRCSNWEALPLSIGQQHYAATDAFASILVHWAIMALPPIVRPVRAPNPPAAVTPSSAGSCRTSPHDASREDECLARQMNQLQCIGTTDATAKLCPSHKHLPPSKLEVLHNFMIAKLALGDIAEQRGIKRSTVESYIADAMLAGHDYDWRRLEISRDTWCEVVKLCRETLDASDTNRPSGDGGNGGAGPVEGGIEGALRQRGLGLKAIRDVLPDDVSYGQVRLCLAHLSRLGQQGPSQEGSS